MVKHEVKGMACLQLNDTTVKKCKAFVSVLINLRSVSIRFSLTLYTVQIW